MTPAWLAAAMVQPCVVYDRIPSGEDEYGNTIYENVIVAETLCSLQPVSQADIQLGRAAAGSFLLFLSAELAGLVTGFASFNVDGLVYEAEGPPAVYRGLYESDVHHVEVNVARSSA